MSLLKSSCRISSSPRQALYYEAPCVRISKLFFSLSRNVELCFIFMGIPWEINLFFRTSKKRARHSFSFFDHPKRLDFYYIKKRTESRSTDEAENFIIMIINFPYDVMKKSSEHEHYFVHSFILSTKSFSESFSFLRLLNLSRLSFFLSSSSSFFQFQTLLCDMYEIAPGVISNFIITSLVEKCEKFLNNYSPEIRLNKWKKNSQILFQIFTLRFKLKLRRKVLYFKVY